ncbi:MAG: xylulokinase [Firmicutes bacterium]|nr:xylulokinase [Bacillota bacterium]
MTRQYVLAYDLGTTGNKAVLVDDSGNLVASAFSPYQTFYPFENAVEQDPWEWWASVERASRVLLETARISPTAIAAISFSGQMMGCVPVTDAGDPIGRAIIWADMRGSQQADQLNQRVGKDVIYRVVGNRANASYSAAKMMWVRDHEPDRFRRTHKFLQPKDFVVTRMTGEFVTDFSDASGTNLFDIRQLRWSPTMIEASGIPQEKLPDVVSSTTIVGSLRDEVAARLGLRGGIPVVVGGGDGACAAAGAGAVDEGHLYQYLGSSSWFGCATSRPLFDNQARIFNWAHVVPGYYAPTGTMQAAGAAFHWFRSILDIQGNNVQTAYQRMDELAEKVPPGADGLIFLPYLLGERSPIWNDKARGTFVGLKMSHTTGVLIRAVMEGVALNMKKILEAFIPEVPFHHIQLIGGGAKSRLWAQIFSDVYGYPMAVPMVLDEATALGAALTGGVGVGLFDGFHIVHQLIEEAYEVRPDPTSHVRYGLMEKLYVAAYEVLCPVFDTLAETAVLLGDPGEKPGSR